LLEKLPRVDDGVMDSLLPKKQPAGEIKFKRVSRAGGNRKRKGAPPIKTMRRFTEMSISNRFPLARFSPRRVSFF